MSSLAVTVEQLTIHPHLNADALELAQVGLYRAVVPKGVYKTGDYAVYIPEGSVLPDGLIDRPTPRTRTRRTRRRQPLQG